MAKPKPKRRADLEAEAVEAHVAAAEAAVEAQKSPGFCHDGAGDEVDKTVQAASARLDQLRAALGTGPARHPGTGQFTAAPRHPIATEGRAADSPANQPATPRAATPWPADSAPLARAISSHGTPRYQVGEPWAPVTAPDLTPPVTLHTFRGGDHAHTSHSAPAVAVVQSVDLRGAAPFPLRTPPGGALAPRAPQGTAPTGAMPPQPRGTGAALTPPGGDR